MDQVKAKVQHSLIWALVAVVAIIAGCGTIAYVTHDDNTTKVQLKENK